MITFVTVIHVIVCVFLILVILLQAGKGGGMGAGLGGGASQIVFGGRGSQSFLGKLTSVSAGIFMLTSVWLAYHSSRTAAVVEEAPTPPAPTAPAAPAPGTPAQGGTAPATTPPAEKGAQPTTK